MNSMPASSAICASARLSSQLPVQRSGTVVTARPDEQFDPNRPILSALSVYIALRSRMAESGGAATSFMAMSISTWLSRRSADQHGPDRLVLEQPFEIADRALHP